MSADYLAAAVHAEEQHLARLWPDAPAVVERQMRPGRRWAAALDGLDLTAEEWRMARWLIGLDGPTLDGFAGIVEKARAAAARTVVRAGACTVEYDSPNTTDHGARDLRGLDGLALVPNGARGGQAADVGAVLIAGTLDDLRAVVDGLDGLLADLEGDA